MNINIWTAVRTTLYNYLLELMEDSEYTGFHSSAIRILRRIVDHESITSMYKKPVINEFAYSLCSLTINNVSGDGLSLIQSSLGEIEGLYTDQFFILGAWYWDGRQVGTQWIDPDDHSQGTSGTPLYPINATQLVKFMPDIWNGSTWVAATELTDVNLIQGQSPRRFT